MKTSISVFNHFLELIFPRVCVVCGQKLIQTEEYLCLKCLLHLPRTNHHLQSENVMEQLFMGRVPIVRAASFFEFHKGSDYQKIIHQLKYKGQKEIGEFMGKRFAAELCETNHFCETDYICPVPLHPKRKRKRGYNQSYHIALGLSSQLQVPLCTDNLKRIKHTNTQTRKSRYDRWQNVEGIFELSKPELFDGKHLILVDDVITTGATIEACANAILKKCDAKISVLTLAIA